MMRDPRTYAIIGCAMAVHRKLGTGFLEAVYQQALEVEFARTNLPYRREVPFDIEYEGVLLKAKYRADFVCFDSVLVELKAELGFALASERQVVNYLRVSGLGTGLLLNFGMPSLEYRRYIYTHSDQPESAQWHAWEGMHPERLGPDPMPPPRSAESAVPRT